MYLLSNLKSCVLLALVIISSSCSQLRYTDYGKPFDFFKSHSDNNKNSVTNKDVIEKRKENTKSISNQTYSSVEKSFTEKELPKKSLNNILLVNEKVALNHSEFQNEVSNIFFQEYSVNPLANSYSLMNQYNRDQNQISYNEQEDVVLMILCVLLPPLAVFFSYDISNEFWIDLLLTLLFFLPGIIYALYVCFYK